MNKDIFVLINTIENKRNFLRSKIMSKSKYKNKKEVKILELYDKMLLEQYLKIEEKIL